MWCVGKKTYEERGGFFLFLEREGAVVCLHFGGWRLGEENYSKIFFWESVSLLFFYLTMGGFLVCYPLDFFLSLFLPFTLAIIYTNTKISCPLLFSNFSQPSFYFLPIHLFSLLFLNCLEVGFPKFKLILIPSTTTLCLLIKKIYSSSSNLILFL